MPQSTLYCYTYANRTYFRNSISVYINGAPQGHTFMAAPDSTRETQRVSSKPKRRLTKNQERRRIEGLRILARIIARHYLANPHLYPNGAAVDGSQADGKEGAA